MKLVGTCGCCGGAVTIPSVWMGVFPPTPKCVSCGAVPREAHGPVLDMVKPKQQKLRYDIQTTLSPNLVQELKARFS